MTTERPSVLILYNLPESRVGKSHAESEAGVLVEVKAVASALTKLGYPHRRAGIRRLRDLPSALRVSPHPIVFNLVEGLCDRPDEFTLVPAVCRAFGKTVTGSDTPCLTLTLDKGHTKSVLHAAGIPVPAGVVVQPGSTIVPGSLDPSTTYIVKPLSSDASEGITPECIRRGDDPGLIAVVERIHMEFQQPALVEAFVGDREINVSVLARGDHAEVLPLAEIDFSELGIGRPKIVDYAAKWHVNSHEYQSTRRLIPAPVSDEIAARLRTTALDACRACGCTDYARVDIRLDPTGALHVLEINPNPDISPEAGFPAALAAAGLTYEAFVQAVVQNALRRHGGRDRAADHGGLLQQDPMATDEIRTRPSVPADRDRILAFVEATGFFKPYEIEIAAEVLDDALAGGSDGHYQSYVVEKRGEPVGWVCFGPTPCTDGTYDVYWVVVAPGVQGKGIGRRAMTEAENRIRARGGRLIVIETSGSGRYEGTRQFYLRLGYQEAARAADFYGPGDDKLVYLKRLQ
jgi:D-alanine-D-alanine ligase